VNDYEDSRISQGNMYCNACFINVLNAILGIRGVYEMDIDMHSKMIRLQMENEAMGKKKIQTLVSAALTVGAQPALVPAC
jgi:copper chaperone CopZ